jgi:hypothetical protein
MNLKKIVKIGLLADSHDHLPRLERAVEFFNEQRVDFLLHAGDYVAPFTIAKLKKLKCDWLGVFGNNDGEKDGLVKASLGRITQGPLRLTLGNKKIILVHDIKSIKVDRTDAQIIVSGHTHIPQIKKKSSLLLVNPGECGGWLEGKSTVAILDLADSTATLHEL